MALVPGMTSSIRYMPLPDRFWTRIERDTSTGCWLWQGAQSGVGYGVVNWTSGGVKCKTRLLHRLTYEALVGPIPEGLVIDHLCRVRHCVNPEHLEPVTNAENSRRGVRKTLQTHCKRGHEFTPENTIRTSQGSRSCRICNRMHQRNYKARLRAAKEQTC